MAVGGTNEPVGKDTTRPGAERDPIDRAIDGIVRLQRAYFAERMIFLAGALVSLIFAAVISIITVVNGDATLSNMLPLLGSGGLFMTTGAGTMLYFGKSFDLLRELAVAARND